MTIVVNIDWNEQNIQTLETMWHAGEPLGAIAIAISGSSRGRNAVLGKAHRMKLGPHPNPQRPSANPMDRAGKRHGNFGQPKPQSVTAARERALAGEPKWESKYLSGDAWEPLPGSTPATLADRKGCCWPVGKSSPQHFCDQPITPGRLEYCPVHMKRYKTKETIE